MGRLAPDMITMDAVIPRTRLPEVLVAIDRMSERYGLAVANVFHAGDGNLHPLILFDSRYPDQVDRIFAMSEEIMKLCVDVGGSLSGEHGIGHEKKDFMDLVVHGSRPRNDDAREKVFNPEGLLNPAENLSQPPRLHRNRQTHDNQHRRNRKTGGGSVVGRAWKGCTLTIDGVSPSKVVRPESIEELADLLTNETGSVVPIGAGTQTQFGNPLRRADCAVDLSRLWEITEYVPEDLTIHVQAGVTLDQIQHALAGEQPVSSSRSVEWPDGHDGRNRRGECAGAVPRRGYDSRLDHRHEGRRNRRPDFQSRRPRGQERHGLRSAEAVHRLARHPGGHR